MRVVTFLPWVASIAAVGVAIADAKERDEATRAIFAELPEELRADAHESIRLATIERISDLEELAGALQSKGYTKSAGVALARIQELKEAAA